MARIFPSGEYATEEILPQFSLRVDLCAPVCVSHNCTVWSLLLLASVLPSGENAMEVTIFCMSFERRYVLPSLDAPQPDFRFFFYLYHYIWIPKPHCRFASVLPSGENAIAVIVHVCPVSVPTCCPVIVSHKRTVRSEPPLAIIVPSGEKASALTTSVFPVNRSSSFSLPGRTS